MEIRRQKTDGMLIPDHQQDYGSVNCNTSDGSGDGKGQASKMTPLQKLTVVTFCISNFCVGAFYSLLGPFFPSEAAAMGANNTMIGLIYGVYELVFVLVSPIFGNFMTTIGAKFMFVAGMMSCGFCCILFGLLCRGPSGVTYIVLAVVLRTFEGIAAGAMVTASFAILGFTFPEQVATMFGALQLFTGLGLMLGPPIGGALFQLGGFMTPFEVSGSVLLVVGIMAAITLPNPQVASSKTKKGSILSLIASPMVPVVGLVLVSGAGCIGFIDVALSPVLRGKYGLSPILTSLVFLVGPGMYALTSPIWGILADLAKQFSVFIPVGGYLVGGLSFWFLGPAPFLHISSHPLWLVLVSQGFMGIGIGTMVVTFQLITETARNKRYPDTLETFGFIAGIFSSFFSFGAFLGPVAGGLLQDSLGFAVTSYIIGTVCMIAAVLLFVAHVIKGRCTPRKPGLTVP